MKPCKVSRSAARKNMLLISILSQVCLLMALSSSVSSYHDPFAIVVMGVSSCGKSTVGAKLADTLGIPFEDGDEFHPKANKDKMKAGVPLTDEDRLGWLELLSQKLSTKVAEGTGVVIACSALKLSYRNILRGLDGDEDKKVVDFVFIQGSYELFAKRIKERKGHFMPASLLKSQFDALEVPSSEEPIPSHLRRGRVITVNAADSIEDIVGTAAIQLRR